MHQKLIRLYTVAGALHFLAPKPFDGLIPAELPGSPRAWTYGSGVAELATAALLASPKTRRLGGAVSVGVLLGVWPGNFEMARRWLRDDTKSLPLKALSIARLPLQLPLIRRSWRIAQGEVAARR